MIGADQTADDVMGTLDADSIAEAVLSPPTEDVTPLFVPGPHPDPVGNYVMGHELLATEPVEPAPPPSPDEQREIDVAFRPRDMAPGSDDEKFINSGFLRGFKASPYTYGLSADVYFGVARQAWAGIQRDMTTTVAHVKGKPDEMMGFITYAKDVKGVLGVAWIHVSKDWRKFGIGTALLQHAGARPRGLEIAALFGNPEAIDKFRRKGFAIRLAPFACWQWLGVPGAAKDAA